MNNFGIISELIENFKNDLALNNKLLIALLVFVGINLLTTIINIISQHHLKNQDKKIISFKIKEEKRIKIFEKIYQKLEEISFFDGKNDSEEFLTSVQQVEKFISNNKLYIGKKELKLIYQITDYYKTVIADFRKKDYGQENKLFQKLNDLFCK